MTQPNPPANTESNSGDSEVSATWLKEQFASFGTKFQALEEKLANLQKPAESSSSQNNQQSPPANNQAQVRQPADGAGTQKPNGPRSILRIGTLKVNK